MNLNAHSAKTLYWSQLLTGGVSIVYRRGKDEVPLEVVPGRANATLLATAGIPIAMNERDFLILAEELILGGNQVEPEKGDEIDIEIGSHVETFEVMPLAGTERAFDYSDPNQVIYRVHVKRISVEANE